MPLSPRDPSAPLEAPVLVVYPSADYQARIARVAPQAVALITPSRAAEPGWLTSRTVVTELTPAHWPAVLDAVRAQERAQRAPFRAVTTYVCEHLPLTAWLAERMGVWFHPPDVVLRCRYKPLAKRRWDAARVRTPAWTLVRDGETVATALEQAAPALRTGPWILKPLAATGSEWVLVADSLRAADRARRTILAAMRARRAQAHPSTDPVTLDGSHLDPARTCLLERLLTGPEWSADVRLDAGTGATRVLRASHKLLHSPAGTAGHVAAYYAPALTADRLRELETELARVFHALGATQGIGMVDWIEHRGRRVFLEVGLRPGGDCLPDWSTRALGYDPILETLRAHVGLPPQTVRLLHPEPVAALHLMTEDSGRLTRLNWAALSQHPDVVTVTPYRQVGDQVRCWPGSYEDRILGACVIRWHGPKRFPAQLATLTRLVQPVVSRRGPRGLRPPVRRSAGMRNGHATI